MLRKRLIPILQVLNGSLVKTRRFKDPKYIGDPVNSSRIFNELCADELVILDISGSLNRGRNEINYELIENLASECFMPLTYGGGIRDTSHAMKLIRIGVEKIAINSGALENPMLINEVSNEIGSSSTLISIDVTFNSITKKFTLYNRSVEKGKGREVLDWMQECIDRGAGEILLTDVSREGTWGGMRHELIDLSNRVRDIPVILQGGIANHQEATEILNLPGISALGVGNLVSFQKQGCGVLVNYPHEVD